MRNRHQIIFLLFIALTFFARTSYCQWFTSDANPSFGDQLIIGVQADGSFKLNPFEIHSTLQKEINELIFGFGLIKTAGKFGSPPKLIEHFIENPKGPDSRIWHLVLKRNVNFHNGDNLRNTDVIFTIELVKKFGGFYLNRQIDLSNIKSITANGDLELTFELYEPDERFDLTLADIPIISEKYYQEGITRGYQIFAEKKPMGMGPFVFQSQSENFLTLNHYLHYYTGRPFLDQVKIRFFEDEQTLIDALVNGEVDYVELPDRETALRLHNLMENKLVIFRIQRPEVKVYTMLFNMNRFPLSEPEVRQAIYLALHRKEIVHQLMEGIGKVANTLIDETNPHYRRSLYTDEYDPQQALRLLQKSGWRLNSRSGILEKNRQSLSFELYFARDSELQREIARIIFLNLGEVNINVNPIPILASEKKAIINRNAYESMLFAYSYDPEYLFQAFDQFYSQILGARLPEPNYRNRYLMRLFDLAGKQKSLRENVYQRFQTFAMQEMPAIFLFFDDRIIIGLSSRFDQFRTIFKQGNRYYLRMNPVENWFVPKELQK